MVGILIVTHGPLANAFKESARMFFDEVADRIQTIGLYPGDTIEDLEGKITNAICNRYDEDGMMVFVDMLAGSPFNMTALTLHKLLPQGYKVECITGINLPLLMEALAGTEYMTLEEMKSTVLEKAQESVVDARGVLGI
ncbi:MAG: PTS sugar transporter subunit IIA [Erysipelotrichales bacterium]|nr:PTS sugar transporter subunit IIA [Erysipelotrichales bacterium]